MFSRRLTAPPTRTQGWSVFINSRLQGESSVGVDLRIESGKPVLQISSLFKSIVISLLWICMQCAVTTASNQPANCSFVLAFGTCIGLDTKIVSYFASYRACIWNCKKKFVLFNLQPLYLENMLVKGSCLEYL